MSHIPLPKLNPLIKLSKGPNKTDGSPSWVLHNPISNDYFRIDWAEFECLARFSNHDNAESLVEEVNSETTLSVDVEDIKQLIIFLNQHGLISLSDQKNLKKPDQKKKPIWSNIVHGYLYFTIPLVKPEAFLRHSFPIVKPLMTKGFVVFMMMVLLAAIVVTFQRLDEFLHTFTQLFSFTGAVMGLCVFAFLKVIHEFAHAYTATKYGVRVPHMGVAFIVMYPVLYTETTGSWQLTSRKERLHIGMAGILAELCLAGIALWIWNIAPAGSLSQSLAFTTVTISMIGSLLVNLNPLMRFDGYYMLCDAIGLENLQNRSCTFARWWLRGFLFADKTPAPEQLEQKTQRFLTLFGFALLIYRFFLFLGIAVLVYVVFPKPLGALLMAIELLWFIWLPIWSELKIWLHKSGSYIKTPRTVMSLCLFACLIVFLILPSKQKLVVPAILHASDYAAIYPEVDSYVEKILITDRDNVTKGQVLAHLSSRSLDKEIQKTEQQLRALEKYRKRLMIAIDSQNSSVATLEDEISTAKQELKNYKKQKENLVIKAPFDGQIRDLNPEIHPKRFVKKDDLFFRVIKLGDIAVTAYVEEHDLDRIKIRDQAVFVPKHSPFEKIDLNLSNISKTKEEYLAWPELSSVYGGPLSSNIDSNNNLQPNQLELLQGIFSIKLRPEQKSSYLLEREQEFTETGTVHIYAAPRSAFASFIRRTYALFIRESGLN